MNQRLLVLDEVKPTNKVSSKIVVGKSALVYQVEVTIPSSPILAPPGYYLLFVVHQEIPSQGVWVQLL
jgi:hypothetical protein